MKRKKHGMYGTKLYTAWANMKKRCNKTRKKDFAEGITPTYCEEWELFTNFMEWANQNGFKEELTLDRIDTCGNYEPSNCRWITMKMQQNNKTSNKFVEFEGQRLTTTQWEEKLGFKSGTIKRRLLRGWDIERALTEELGIGRKNALKKRKRDKRGRLI